MATFTTEVLGDKRIYTCSQGSGDCPAPTTVTTATGLGPKFEAEYDVVQPLLSGLASGSATSGSVYADLQKIAAPGMAVSPQLLAALRRLPPDTRDVAVNRLSQELAMHRVIDKALVARAALLTGMSLPQVTAAGEHRPADPLHRRPDVRGARPQGADVANGAGDYGQSAGRRQPGHARAR